MKRTNVVLDEELLERARQVTGERTYSAVVTKGLEELVRVAELKRAIQAMRDTKDFFFPGYPEMIRPNLWTPNEKKTTPSKGSKARKKVARAARSR